MKALLLLLISALAVPAQTIISGSSPVVTSGTVLTSGGTTLIDESRTWTGSTTGLEGQYFLEGSGQVVTDTSTNGRDAQLGSTSGSDTNDPLRVAGHQLTLTTDDYVLFPTALHTALDGAAEATVYIVARLDAATPAASGDTGWSQFGNDTGASLYPDTTGEAFIDTFRSNPNRVENITLTSVDRSSWHVVSVATKNGAGNWRLDQNTSTATTAAGQATVSLPTDTAEFRFGFDDAGPVAFDGTLAAILFYSTWHDTATRTATYTALRQYLAQDGVSLPPP